ncbi:hypothetical protein FB451DRAFT_1096491 [Mycena latifolia]|nr:hypothetical protein FB451DRAFT_1096491 [Mycena latifolia]
MLSAPDFNFVVCGIATIAATVGYACARKVRPLPSRGAPQNLDPSSNREELSKTLEKPFGEINPTDGDPHSDMEVETIAVGGNLNSSLKRKRAHDSDQTDQDVAQGYPHNLKSIYPNKRRSGSVSDPEPDEKTDMTPAACDSSTNEQPQIVVPDSNLSDSASALPAKPDVVGDSPIPEVPEPEPAVTEPVRTERPRFVFPQTLPRMTQFPSTRSSASPGFANFAGSSSPFATSPSKDTAVTFGKAVWAGATETEVSAGETAATSSVDGEPEGKKDPLPALAAAKAPTVAMQTPLTGEEEEDVTLELKGVKLFIKRGDDNFSGGMVGHIKLLSHKTTLSKRLLFRREPLWKVSMNVRMLPSVRCTYDVQENILRVALKELEDKSDSSNSTPQIVIYAFKPGRSCRRSDFQVFAESLLAQARTMGQS